MRRFDTTYIVVLGVGAVAALVLGIWTIYRAQTVAYDRANRFPQVLAANLQSAEDTLRTLQEHRTVADKIGAAAGQARRTVRYGPTLMKNSGELLAATSDTLENTATSMRNLGSTFGIVLPGGQLKKNAEAMEETSQRLQKMHEAMMEMYRWASQTRSEVARARKAIAKLRRDLSDATPGLSTLRGRVHELQVMAEKGYLAQTVANQGTLTGGLYILGGLILAGLCGLWYRLVNVPLSRSKT